MPFTLAHPAAVLPFLRGPWSTPALVAGTLAPDVPYYARVLPVPVSAQSWYEPYLNATTSHSLAGTLVVALPYALLLTVVWWAARRPLRSLLVPEAEVAGRAGGEDASSSSGSLRAGDALAGAGWVVVSALVGIATHLAWDRLTDSARLLQHLSTGAGLVALALATAVLLHRRPSLRVQGRVLAWGGTVLATSAVVGAVVEHRSAEGASLEHWLRAGAESAGLVLGLSLVVFVAGWWLRGDPSSG